ncbi:MAG: alpha-L-fucosidase, partial [Bacteroidetes bacterium]|nr:alpha-L-fucosidase [Bacteroidota bacterium]
MKRILILILLSFCLLPRLSAQKETLAQHDQRMQWWREARFGMFIHWGIYSVPAGIWKGKTGYGEWIRTSAEIPLETYDEFRSGFNPTGFNADEWVKAARDAGMKYIVITSKHHDGFCMFDTKQTDFNIMKTPFQRDPMKELAAACQKYGLKFCFYYSIMDWHHPDYLPRREWEKDRPAGDADYNKYVAYMKAELKELLTQYGNIGVLWFDGEWE